MNLTWLAADLRAAGIDVREVDGWQTRAVPGTFNPLGVLIHHTGSPATGDAPSLAVCINGRLGLTGPLCQGLIARSGLLYLIAGGAANHAGKGDGLTPMIPTDFGNHVLLGWELENTGTGEPWPARQVEVAQIATAVVLRRLQKSALWVWGHKEYAPGRKPDPVGINMAQFRAAVAHILNPPPPIQEDDMPGLHQLGAAMATMCELYQNHRGKPPTPEEWRSWSKDIEARLARGEDLTPVYVWAAATLDAEKVAR